MKVVKSGKKAKALRETAVEGNCLTTSSRVGTCWHRSINLRISRIEVLAVEVSLEEETPREHRKFDQVLHDGRTAWLSEKHPVEDGCLHEDVIFVESRLEEDVSDVDRARRRCVANLSRDRVLRVPDRQYWTASGPNEFPGLVAHPDGALSELWEALSEPGQARVDGAVFIGLVGTVLWYVLTKTIGLPKMTLLLSVLYCIGASLA
uniref:Reticulon-like protein n=1 Tax=Steinernema glaseri TaxID=37863 RepID=A0A1I7ZAF9_9BILA